ncbi:hypothetical protein [Streptomyces crystallinus]|uniref:Uncharacterized protein n=1 Tax=Streptomyces crystallinus TaxID=68191 RepID=A0ABP3RML9_9ACTN
MRRVIATAFAIAMLAGTAATTATTAAAGESGKSSLHDCRLDWNDANTAGIKCWGGTFVGWAVCKNGSRAQGQAAYPGTTSYACCSSYGSSLVKPVRWGAVQVR